MSKNSLGSYIEEVYNDFKNERQTLLESKWQKNIDAFKMIDNDEKKKKKDETKDWRSDVFVGITKQKVLSGYAIVIDTLLSGGKIPYLIVSDELERQKSEGLPEDYLANNERAIELMGSLIDSQIKDGKTREKFSKMVLACAIYGVTYGKIEYKTVVNRRYELSADTVSETGDALVYTEVVDKKDIPALKYLSCWDVFTDIENGTVNDGRGVIVRNYVTMSQLKALQNDETYNSEIIQLLIDENNTEKTTGTSTNDKPVLRGLNKRKNTVEVLEFYGRAPLQLVEMWESLKEDGELNDENVDYTDTEIEVTAVCVKGKVIKLIRRDEDEPRPLFEVRWEDLIDCNYGVGIADNLEDSQAMVNTMVRAFIDNKNLSGNVILAIRKRLLANKLEELKPGALIEVTEDCKTVREAVEQLTIQDVGSTILNGIELAFRMADDDSNIPRIQQGQGGTGKETAFELSQRLEKSGKYLASVIRNFDDGLIEPLVNEFLRYNMLSTEVPPEFKRAFRIVGNGFTSFQSRVNRISSIRQLIELAMQIPEMKNIKFSEIFREFARLLDVDPDIFVKSKEELQQESSGEEEKMRMEQEAQSTTLDKVKSEIELNRARAESELVNAKVKAEEIGLKQQKELVSMEAINV